MADTRGIRAGRAFVELGVSDKLTAGLRNAQKRLQAFGAGVRSIGVRLVAVGAGLLAPFAASVKTFSTTGDALDKMAIRTGISVETLSELAFAADQSGTSLETLESGVRIMQRTITEAERGMASAKDTLADLNLTVKQLRGLSPEEQFKLVADRLSEIADPTKRAALAMKVLGRSGTQLLPLFEDGANGIEELQRQARALGLTISTETAKDAALLNDTLGMLWTVLKQGVFVIGSALAPKVIELSNAVTRVVVSTTQWVKQNKAIVIMAAKIAAGVAVAGIALIGLGLMISGVGMAFGILASVAGGVATVIGLIGTAIAALISPIGIAVVAIAGLGTALLISSGAGAQALAWLSDQFTRLRDFVTKVMGGIADALAAGDVPLAAQILWLSLKQIWQQGAASLNQVWLSVKNFFVTTAQSMWYGAVAAAQIGFHALEVAWIETTAFLSKTWTKFSTGFQKIWEQATSFVAKRMLEIQGIFDSSLDVEAAKRAVDQQLDARLSELDQQAQRDLASRESHRQRDRDHASNVNEATLAEIGRQFDEAQHALKSGSDQQIAETQRELEEARRKLDEAIAEARRKREERDDESSLPGRRSPNDLLAELEDRFASLGATVARDTVRGTFNASALQSLQATSSAEERTAKATEQTAQNTRRLIDEVRRSGGLAFT